MAGHLCVRFLAALAYSVNCVPATGGTRSTFWGIAELQIANCLEIGRAKQCLTTVNFVVL